ncbi:unnamed protein product, partial [Scytosiphon promiscuus]
MPAGAPRKRRRHGLFRGQVCSVQAAQSQFSTAAAVAALFFWLFTARSLLPLDPNPNSSHATARHFCLRTPCRCLLLSSDTAHLPPPQLDALTFPLPLQSPLN